MRLHSIINSKTGDSKRQGSARKETLRGFPLRLDFLNEPASTHLRAITSEITERAREKNRTPLRVREHGQSILQESSVASNRGGVNTIKGIETFRFNPENSIQDTDRQEFIRGSLTGFRKNRKLSV